MTFSTEPLTDRQVDELADVLWNHGDGGDIVFEPIDDPNSMSRFTDARICGDCGERYINWGAHAERCYGRPAVTWVREPDKSSERQT